MPFLLCAVYSVSPPRLRTYILWLPAASHWYFSPWIVAMTRRVCFAARNSRYQMPCHVPVACTASVSVVLPPGGGVDLGVGRLTSLPSLMGMVTLAPISEDLM